MISQEVVGLILSNLDTLSDLLTCRLVSRSWNQESTFLLRKSKFRKRILSSDLRSCVESMALADGATPFKFILPFDLVHDQAVQGNSESEAEFGARCASTLQEMDEDVSQLYQVCGPNALPDCDVTCWPSCDPATFIALHKFLTTISGRVVKLDLTFGSSQSLTLELMAQILKSNPLITFPKLKELDCLTQYPSDEAEREGTREDLEGFLIERAPNLDTLYLGADVGFNYWPRNASPAIFQKLKSLKAKSILNRVEFLNAIRSSQFEPILETFEFSTSECRDAEVGAMQDILACFSGTLKSIAVSLDFDELSRSLVASHFQFPRLPKMEHVVFEFCRYGTPAIPAYMSLEGFNFCPETFPALTSVQIPFGWLLTSPPILPAAPPAPPGQFLAIPHPRTIFPAVTHLTFQVSEATFHDVSMCSNSADDDMDEFIAWEDFQCKNRCEPRCTYAQRLTPQAFVDLTAVVFPNVAHVTVTNLNEDREQTVARVIRAVAQSDSALAIETFEVQDYDEDYLSSILDDEPTTFVNKMTNVKKIILKCDKKLNKNYARTAPPQSLMYLSHRFSKLEQVEISAVLVEQMKVRLGRAFESKLKAVLNCNFKLI